MVFLLKSNVFVMPVAVHGQNELLVSLTIYEVFSSVI